MAKIKVANPVVELDGDEMTRIIWQLIKDKLIHPYLDIELLYYDLGIENRDETDDQVTIDAAEAIKKHGVGVKCATITPDEARVKEFNLKKMWKLAQRHHPQHPRRRRSSASRSSARTCRAWCRAGPSRSSSAATPIGDQYRATDFKVPGKGKLTITFVGDGRQEDRARGVRLPGRRRRHGDVQPRRIRSATSRAPRSTTALQRGYPVYLSTKNTILKVYDGRFKDIFQEVFDGEFKAEFKKKQASPTSTA